MTRGYSKKFPTVEGARTAYTLDRIPIRLWLKVRAKAEKDRVSVRALILQLLTDWVRT